MTQYQPAAHEDWPWSEAGVTESTPSAYHPTAYPAYQPKCYPAYQMNVSCGNFLEALSAQPQRADRLHDLPTAAGCTTVAQLEKLSGNGQQAFFIGLTACACTAIIIFSAIMLP